MSTLLEQKYNSSFYIHNDTNEKQQVLYPTTSLPPNQKTSGTTRRLTTSKAFVTLKCFSVCSHSLLKTRLGQSVSQLSSPFNLFGLASYTAFSGLCHQFPFSDTTAPCQYW